MRFLFVSADLACPDFHGGCAYPHAVMEALRARGAEIEYLWKPTESRLGPFRLPFRPSFASRIHVWGSADCGGVYFGLPWRNRRDSLGALVARRGIDAVIVDFVWLASLLHKLPVPGMVLTHELIHRRTASYLRAGMLPDFSTLDEEEEAKRLAPARVLIAIQEEDAEWLRGRFPDRTVITIPHPVEVCPLPEPGGSPSCLFLGGNTAHNRAALQWFVDGVWPQVRQKLPAAEFRIYGRVQGTWDRPGSGIRYVGPVADPRQAYAECQVAAVPLRFGSGLKIKLMEAMAFGRPAVATPVGAEGFADLRSGGVCPVEEHPEAFAQRVVELLSERSRRERIAGIQADWLRRHASPAMLADRLLEAAQGCGGPERGAEG